MKKKNLKNNNEKQKSNFQFQTSNLKNVKNKKRQVQDLPLHSQNKKSNFDDQVEGRNSVLELLESGKDINKIFVSRGEKQGSINKIIAKAKENRIIIVEVDKNKLDEMSGTRSSSRCNCNCTTF